MARTIGYTGRYLDPETVEDCFVSGRVTAVDKTLCGNGFSTACLAIKPKKGKLNILIAPNKAVVMSKEQDYKKGLLPGDNTIKFFYMESMESDFKDTDILFFVADSFLMMAHKIDRVKNLVDKILIDECHSIEIQSLFRKNLVGFPQKVRELCPSKHTSIVTVTASPNLYSPVDVRLMPEHCDHIEVHVEHDLKSTVNRIKSDLENRENVVVFTNAARNIYLLRDMYGCVNARFIVGSTFLQSLYETVRIEENTGSNLTIVSARGFEGFDLHYENARVYFLEDRSYPFQTFYLSNLYQAISRCRKGAAYVEYSRMELSKKRKKPFANIERSVDKFIKDSSLSAENKQKKEHADLHPFVVFDQDKEGTFSVSPNRSAIDLFEESLLYDDLGKTNAFDDFLLARNIVLSFTGPRSVRISPKVTEEEKIRNLYDNRLLVERSGVFGEDFRMNPEAMIYSPKEMPLRLSYLKYMGAFLRRKNYDKGNPEHYEHTDRQEKAIELLGDRGKFNRLLRKLIKTYNQRSIEKFGTRASEPYRREFRLQATTKLCQLIIMMANDRISVPGRWIANRDYNLLVGVGMDEIRLIADVFGTKVEETDIKSCFPRVLYALCGLCLPKDFYGKRKTNKLKINIALNDFFHDPKGAPKKSQKQGARKKLEQLGIDTAVTTYLIDNFFEAPFRGDLFNLLSFHEKKIVTKVKKLLKEKGRNQGVVRRHDSVVIFENSNRNTFLNDLEFLGKKRWFDVPDTPSKLYRYEKGTIFETNNDIPF